MRALQATFVQSASARNEPPSERIERVLALVEQQAATADLLLLPELWPSGYFAFDRYEEDAQAIDGPLVERLRGIAARNECHIFGGSFIEAASTGLHNTATLIDDQGAVVLTYRKFHLFGLATSRESTLLTAGDDVGVVDTALGVVGVMTCYDLRFPELARLMMDRGAEIILVTAAWPRERLEHWRLLTRTRALENQVFLLACNAAEQSGDATMAGHSVAVDPWGDILTELGDGPEVRSVPIDLRELDTIRDRFPVLRDRRIPVARPTDG